jgi:hypothetical protein
VSYTSAIEPQIYNTMLPQPATLTVATEIDVSSNGFVSVFLTNQGTVDDRVRLAVRPLGDPVDDQQYLLYDTRLTPQAMLIIPNVGLNGGDQILCWSLFGTTSFVTTGQALINSV